ncbi:hypothetical protein KC19_7G057000 [Ceratodon purpureus]|uniref:ALA-interacting subunit n=1 Tax=Ceratodon purpureus TaxID=3225 RepID=A0A8T0H6K5_CERPU|nr:hypothetical protein KC19_7G057000 [Ceratodon purpureus]
MTGILQAAEAEMEEEIALDDVGDLSTPNQIFMDDEGETSSTNQSFLDDGGETSTTNQSFLDDDGGSSVVKLLLLGNARGASLLTQLKQTIFHQLKYTKFTQQELPAWKPVITPKWAMIIFMVVGIFSIPIGIVTLAASHNVVQIVHRYDRECMRSKTLEDSVSYIQNPSVDHRCNVTLVVPKMMKNPVFVFYELDKFHQNHRRYMKSRSTKQHQGEDRRSVDSCHPIARVSKRDPIIPCGLIAWTLFNDTYEFGFVNSPNGPALHIPVVQTGIAWKSDVKVKFSNKVYPENFPNNINNSTGRSRFPVGGASLDPALPLSKHENLMVWMRTAPMPRFRKLYGRIEHNLHAGQVINVSIANVYNTYSYKGSKRLVLSTTSFLGGKNPFLGRAYLTMGVLCMLMALVSIFVQFRHPREFGDKTRLTWNREPSELYSC